MGMYHVVPHCTMVKIVQGGGRSYVVHSGTVPHSSTLYHGKNSTGPARSYVVHSGTTPHTVSVKKMLKYVRCSTVTVLCWCGRSTLLVHSWCALGALMVRSWCALGTLMVCSRVQLTNRYGTVRGSVR